MLPHNYLSSTVYNVHNCLSIIHLWLFYYFKGQIASDSFEDVGHSEDARELMKDYCIGELADVRFPCLVIWLHANQFTIEKISILDISSELVFVRIIILVLLLTTLWIVILEILVLLIISFFCIAHNRNCYKETEADINRLTIIFLYYDFVLMLLIWPEIFFPLTIFIFYLCFYLFCQKEYHLKIDYLHN